MLELARFLLADNAEQSRSAAGSRSCEAAAR
jgi:hypothetical protein